MAPSESRNCDGAGEFLWLTAAAQEGIADYLLDVLRVLLCEHLSIRRAGAVDTDTERGQLEGSGAAKTPNIRRSDSALASRRVPCSNNAALLTRPGSEPKVAKARSVTGAQSDSSVTSCVTDTARSPVAPPRFSRTPRCPPTRLDPRNAPLPLRQAGCASVHDQPGRGMSISAGLKCAGYRPRGRGMDSHPASEPRIRQNNNTHRWRSLRAGGSSDHRNGNRWRGFS